MAKSTPSKKTTKAKAATASHSQKKKAAAAAKSSAIKAARPAVVVPTRHTAAAKTPARPVPAAASAPASNGAGKAKITKTDPKGAAKLKPFKDRPGRTGAPATPVTRPPLSVASDKPVKNQAGLKPKDLEYFRDLLLAKRRELVGDVTSMEQEALRSATGSNLSNLPMHMADMGTDNYEQEFTLGLVEKDRELLREINVALEKIRNGTYGICEGTGKPINRVRLEILPWARYSIEYAQRLEKNFIRRIG